MAVTLYQHDLAGGERLKVSHPISDLRDWNFNDKTSSLIVDQKTTFFEDINYGGARWELSAGKYTLGELAAHGIPNDVISSFYF